MRYLMFDVHGQKLTKDSACDFEGLVRGSKQYLTLSATFDAEWQGFTRVALFNEQYAVALSTTNSCNVPDEVTDGDSIHVRIVGVSGERRIRTNCVVLAQIK